MEIVYKKISTGIRPQKMAVFFNKDSGNWKSIIEGIIEIFSTMWGGNFNVIIPTDGKVIEEHFMVLLKEFDPDICCYYQSTNLDQLYSSERRAEREETIKTLMVTHEFSRQLAERQLTTNAHPDEIDIFKNNTEFQAYLTENLTLFGGLRKMRLPKLHRRSRNRPGALLIEDFFNDILEKANPRPFDFDLEQCAPLIRPLIASYTGIGNHLYSGRADIHIEKVEQMQETQMISNLYQGRVKPVYPFAVSSYGLSTFYKSNFQKSSSILIVGSRVDDFSLFYSLDRIMNGVFWLPSIECFYDYCPGLGLLILEKIAEENVEMAGSVLKLTSCSASREELARIVTLIEELSIPEFKEDAIEIAIVNPGEIKPHRDYDVYEHGNARNTFIQQFNNGISTNYIDSPYPKIFSNLPAHKANWLIDYEIEAVDFDSSSTGHILPNDRLLISALFNNDFNNKIAPDALRKHGHKYSVRCPTVLLRHFRMTPQDVTPRPILRLQESIEIFESLFRILHANRKNPSINGFIPKWLIVSLNI